MPRPPGRPLPPRRTTRCSPLAGLHGDHCRSVDVSSSVTDHGRAIIGPAQAGAGPVPDSGESTTATTRWSTPIHVALLGVWPILFLAADNLGEVELGDVVVPFVAGLAVALAAFAIVRLVVRDSRKAALIVSVGLLSFYLFGHAVNAAKPVRILNETRLLLVWLGLTALAVIVLLRTRRDLSSLTVFANAVALVLVATSLFAIVTFQVGASRVDGAAAVVPSGPASPAPSRSPLAATLPAGSFPAGSGAPGAAGALRDIYYIVVEDFGSRRILREELGAQHDGFFEGLEDRGFEVLTDTRSNYGRSVISLASSLNMTYLDDVAAAAGRESTDYGPLNRMVRNPEVARFLQDRGYSFVQIGSQYSPTAQSDLADVNPRFRQTNDFVSVLYDTTVVPTILSRFGVDGPLDTRRKVYDAAVWQYQAFTDVTALPGPKFVFLHVFLPHPPYVVDADGGYVSRDRDFGRSLQDRMNAQFEFAERQVGRLIDPLLAVDPSHQPIIVVTTDEGLSDPDVPETNGGNAWGQATTDELDEHFAIFAAYHLPGLDASRLYPTMTSVNAFRLILSEYFGADLPLLPDRSFAHQDPRHPYDLEEITDRLDAIPKGDP